MVCIVNAFLRLMILILAAQLFSPTSSLAITAELAKKCRSMALQAHPTQLPGRRNTGVEAAQREYFSKCITNEGKMDTAQPDQNGASGPPDAPPVTGGPPVIGAPTTVPTRK